MFFLVLFHWDKKKHLRSLVANKKLPEFLAITDKNGLKIPNRMRKYFGKVFMLRFENPELRNEGASCRLNECCLGILEYFAFLEAVSASS